MRKIKINFVDFWKEFDSYNNDILNVLKKYYEIEISNEPDYIFFSCFGLEFTKYNCVRIFVTGENIRPDFNVCDYAMGFDYMEFGDRYIRFPMLGFWYNRDSWFKDASNKHIFEDSILKTKPFFCNFIYSNGDTEVPREMFFNLLSEYKRVDSLGRFLNNAGKQLGPAEVDKIEQQRKYKFSIAFENSSMPGYSTEKILEAFAAQTIPIYYGDPTIGEMYNNEAFINCHKYSSWEQVLKRVKEVNENDELYLQILRQPINVGNHITTIYDMEQFLIHIFEQDVRAAYRRGEFRWAKRCEYIYESVYLAETRTIRTRALLWFRRIFKGRK